MSWTDPRRDNGLGADSYRRLRDVQTQLVDGLLERLREEGVAAYSAPAPGARGPYGDTVPPTSPSDAVWVDSERVEHARRVAEHYLSEAAEDLAWTELVAGFHEDASDPVPRWPVSEDVERGRPTGSAEASGPASPGAYDLTADRPVAPRARPLDDDHYVPEPPPPLPELDLVSRFAWAGALGGPLVLLLATIAGLPLTGWVGGVAVAVFVAGFVTLVARMPDRPPTDSGPDDGAVV